MKLLTILFVFFLFSNSYGNESSCSFINTNNNNIKHIRIVYHYQCFLDDLLFEKIEIIPWGQFAISKIDLFNNLDFDKNQYNMLTFKSILGHTISYRPKNNFRETVYFIHLKEDRMNNLNQMIIYASKKQSAKIYSMNSYGANSEFFKKNFVNKIKIIEKKELTDSLSNNKKVKKDNSSTNEQVSDNETNNTNNEEGVDRSLSF